MEGKPKGTLYFDSTLVCKAQRGVIGRFPLEVECTKAINQLSENPSDLKKVKLLNSTATTGEEESMAHQLRLGKVFRGFLPFAKG